MKKEKQSIHGWINLDKPYEMTSTRALGCVKRLLNPKKAGHAGTLDPLATGCLPIALGEATKTIQFTQSGHKVYEFTVNWGEERTTDDAEGSVIASSCQRPTQQEIESILSSYTGEIKQTPPQFAAVKIGGRRAYEIARSGEEAQIKPRRVTVYTLTLSSVDLHTASFRAECGKGVYIRSLARDFGRDLGCFGYVSFLRRLKVGPFVESDMITLDKLEKIVHSSELDTVIHPVSTALDDIPAITLTEEEAVRIRRGQKLDFCTRAQVQRLEQAGATFPPPIKPLRGYALFAAKPVALIEVRGTKIHPVRIFNL